MADFEFANSRAATEQLVEHINNQDGTAPVDTEQLKTTRRRIAIAKEKQSSSLLQTLRENMSSEQLRANDLATMKGGSSWLTTLPLKSENFGLNKRQFYDALSLRYRWTPKYLPSMCPCGKRFDVDHAMSCMKGWFVYTRHDDVRDLFATLFKDVCHDVEVEPHLETLTGELLSNSANSSDEARLDFSARRFWQKGQAFFDVRVFKPFAKRHLNRKLDTAFKSNENEKKRTYNQHVIEIEHGSFSPLVFTPYGGTGREAERFMTEQAQKLAERKNMTYNTIMHWLRSKLSFNLLKSAVICLRRSRRSKSDLNMHLNEAEISKIKLLGR